MLTKKTFEMIATELRLNITIARDENAAFSDDARAHMFAITENLAERFARQFEQDNKRFDRDRFMRACGVKS